MLVEDLERLLEGLAPSALAEPWDAVGLLVGRRGAEVGKVLVALDLTEEVLTEALSDGFDAVVTHHPLLFTPLKRVTDSDRRGLLVSGLLRADAALFALHTNLDAAVGGLCDLAAHELGLVDEQPLVRPSAGWKKLVGFVPADSLERVSRAVYAAGAGTIGAYRGCGFESAGEGTFTPGEGARPAIGRVGTPERVPEVRWETVVPAGRVAPAVQAYLTAHPYDEPAFDVYPLEDVLSRGGQGRVGRTRTATSLLALAETAAEVFGLAEVSYCGDPERRLDKVAVVTGSGGSLMEAAAGSADALVTGDLRYHDAERAEDLGLALVVVPHGHLEAWAMERWAETLEAALTPSRVEVRYSRGYRSPWRKARAVRASGPHPDGSHGGAEPLFDVEEAGGTLVMRPWPEAPGAEGPPVFILRTDGGSRGNPGPSAIGVVLESAEGTVLEEVGARIGTATNNQAEYQALITGLETAIDRGVQRVRVLADSELLVRQLRQEYRVKNEDLRELYLQARSLMQQFERVEIQHVPREENHAADDLVNRALDGLL